MGRFCIVMVDTRSRTLREGTTCEDRGDQLKATGTNRGDVHMYQKTVAEAHTPLITPCLGTRYSAARVLIRTTPPPPYTPPPPPRRQCHSPERPPPACSCRCLARSRESLSRHSFSLRRRSFSASIASSRRSRNLCAAGLQRDATRRAKNSRVGRRVVEA